MNNIGKKLKMENYFAVGSNGKSESLVMLRNYETRVNITSFSNHHIIFLVVFWWFQWDFEVE